MPPVPTRPLLPLPAQPDGVPWPTTEWPTASAADLGADQAAVDALLDELVGPDEHPVFGRTYAAAVVAGGRLVATRFGRRVVQDLRSLEPDAPLEDLGPDAELLSWSMAKSLTNLAVGVAVGDGALAMSDRVEDPQWAGADDARSAITWDDLLTMRPGLAWTEAYTDFEADAIPDVITMLFGSGAADMGAYAASFPLTAEPGTLEAFIYSSGTTNIIAANLQRLLGLDAAAMDRFLHERILDPIGMTDLRASYDDAGTFIGSSYTWATLESWCRFGLLALRDGVWDGQRIVPEGWIDWSRTARSWDETLLHGAQWWTWDQDQMPFGAHGFEGQRIICFPTRDVIVVRFGKTDAANTTPLNAHLTKIANQFPER
jgi:CubicO group peptidase (beta-lactamase class C family)